MHLGMMQPVHAASTTALTLHSYQTVSGVAGFHNMRVLVTGQADATTNGIYLMRELEWVRPADAPTWEAYMVGMRVGVDSGAETFLVSSASRGGLTFLREAFGSLQVTFDATGGMAQGTRLLGPNLPAGVVITRAYYDVITTFTSGGGDAGSIGIGIDTDDVSGIVLAWPISGVGNIWDAGYHETIQTGTAANFSVKTTGVRRIEFVVAVQDLTAGRLSLVCEYAHVGV